MKLLSLYTDSPVHPMLGLGPATFLLIKTRSVLYKLTYSSTFTLAMSSKPPEDSHNRQSIKGHAGYLLQDAADSIKPHGTGHYYAWPPRPSEEEIYRTTIMTQGYRGLLKGEDDTSINLTNVSQATSIRLQPYLFRPEIEALEAQGKLPHATKNTPISGFTIKDGRWTSHPTRTIMGTDSDYFGPCSTHLAKPKGGSWLYQLDKITVDESDSSDEDDEAKSNRRNDEAVYLELHFKLARIDKSDRPTGKGENSRSPLRRSASSSSKTAFQADVPVGVDSMETRRGRSSGILSTSLETGNNTPLSSYQRSSREGATSPVVPSHRKHLSTDTTRTEISYASRADSGLGVAPGARKSTDSQEITMPTITVTEVAAGD